MSTLNEKTCPECTEGLVGTVNKQVCKNCGGTGKVYTENDNTNDEGSVTDAEKGPDDGGIVGMVLRWVGLRFAL